MQHQILSFKWNPVNVVYTNSAISSLFIVNYCLRCNCTKYKVYTCRILVFIVYLTTHNVQVLLLVCRLLKEKLSTLRHADYPSLAFKDNTCNVMVRRCGNKNSKYLCATISVGVATEKQEALWPLSSQRTNDHAHVLAWTVSWAPRDSVHLWRKPGRGEFTRYCGPLPGMCVMMLHAWTWDAHWVVFWRIDPWVCVVNPQLKPPLNHFHFFI